MGVHSLEWNHFDLMDGKGVKKDFDRVGAKFQSTPFPASVEEARAHGLDIMGEQKGKIADRRRHDALGRFQSATPPLTKASQNTLR